MSAIPPAIRRLEQVMGTTVTFDLWSDGGPSPELWCQLASARAVLQRADAIFSTWRASSPMSLIRRDEIGLVDAPTVVAEVLEQCALARELSRGVFDPWAMPGGLDPTGFVKGWAAAKALAAIDSRDVEGVVVNAAGDVATRGTPPGGGPWRIGIVDPRATTRLVAVAAIEGCLATSGTYERGAHLVDPRSGERVARVASASVSGPDLGLADTLATALAVAGRDGLEMVEEIEGYEAFVVTWDGELASTPGFSLVVDEVDGRVSSRGGCR